MRAFVASLALALAACGGPELTFQPICTFLGSSGFDLACTSGASHVGSPHDPMRWGMVSDDQDLLRADDLMVKGSGVCVAPDWGAWATDRTDQIGIIESDAAGASGHCAIWVVHTRGGDEVGRLEFDLRAPDHLATVAMMNATSIPAPAGYDQAWSVPDGTPSELDVEQIAGADVVMGVPTLSYDDPDHIAAPISGGSELELVPTNQPGDHAVTVHAPAFGLSLRVLIRVP